MTTQTKTASLTTDLADVTGRVIAPGNRDYDAARSVFYGGIDKRPAVIVQVESVDDVQRAVDAARERGYELAVRSGGHSIAGHSMTDGGIVIDLRCMKGIEIDPATKTAWIQTGATAVEVTTAAAKHGLTLGFGDSGSVGVSGITLGGGVGFLTRKFGLTIDSLLAAEIVTADGWLRRVDADNEPDLFWAIRGGGGNFGVLTRVKFQLHALPFFTGGLLFLPATPETIAGFVDAALAAPEELSTIGNVMPCPPMPFVPAEAHGKLVILGMMAYAGDDAAAERALAPFRALATPYADLVKPMPYPAMFPPEDHSIRPTAIARTMFIDGFDRSLATTIHERLSNFDGMRAVQIRVLGGAVSRVAPDATAYAHRSRPILVNVASFYTTPGERRAREQWVPELARLIQPNDDCGYIGFLADEGEARVRAAYPGATWDRLRQIKAKYDPRNLFRLNQNIAPAAA
jgi:hypothetical protein